MLRYSIQSQPLAPARILSLNGEWSFQLDPDGTHALDTIDYTGNIPVPMPWQALSPEMRRYSGYAWYHREVELANDFLAGEVLLTFGAVDYWCEVFVNGDKVGEHEGGFTPFTFPVRRYLTPGMNSVDVRVFDPVQDRLEIPRWAEQKPAGNGQPFQEQEIPHGKQEWYVNVGGIWQDVTLAAVPVAWVESLRILPNIANESARVTVSLNGLLDELDGATLSLTLLDGDQQISAQVIRLKKNCRQYELVFSLPNPTLWTLDDPHLYTLAVSMTVQGQTMERAERFGMRSFEARGGKFYLNNQPVYLLAALDQDFYPETVYTTPSEDYLRDEFRKVKELGLNTLRIHIKVPDPIYFDLADEMGLLVWAEIPSWRTIYPRGLSDAERLAQHEDTLRRVRRTFDAMLERDYNHPSLVIRTIVNEDWGTTLAHSPADRAWLAEFFDYAKSADPSRVVVDNSPCQDAWTPNLHVKSEMEDFHIYTSFPEGIHAWRNWIKALARRPLWTFSGHGDSQRKGDEVLVLSEFGNWSLPLLSDLRRSAGISSGEPEWMNVLPWGANLWEKELGYPPGLEERFLAFGLNQIWPAYDDFARSTQWHQYEAMKHEIEDLRREPRFQGYVITELTDIYWESNGLMDFARNPKAYHDVFRQVNAPDVVSALPDRYTFWGGETAELRLYASHYSGRAVNGATLTWQLEGTTRGGSLEVPAAPRGTAGQVGKIFFTLPDVETVTQARLKLALVSLTGETVAENHVDLTLYPLSTRQAPEVGLVAVVDGTYDEPVYGATAVPIHASDLDGGTSQSRKPALAYQLEELGYRTTSRLTPDVSMAITHQVNEELLAWVRAGGDLLYITDGHSPFFWLQGRGGVYGGAWISSWSWARPDVHPRTQPRNPFGIEAVSTMPQVTILGFPYEQAMRDGDVLAGMVSGWVRHPAAHTLQFRLGKGRVIMTTFRLAWDLQWNPLAVAMLNDLAAYMKSGKCHPKLQANY